MPYLHIWQSNPQAMKKQADAATNQSSR